MPLGLLATFGLGAAGGFSKEVSNNLERAIEAKNKAAIAQAKLDAEEATKLRTAFYHYKDPNTPNSKGTTIEENPTSLVDASQAATTLLNAPEFAKIYAEQDTNPDAYNAWESALTNAFRVQIGENLEYLKQEQKDLGQIQIPDIIKGYENLIEQNRIPPQVIGRSLYNAIASGFTQTNVPDFNKMFPEYTLDVTPEGESVVNLTPRLPTSEKTNSVAAALASQTSNPRANEVRINNGIARHYNKYGTDNGGIYKNVDEVTNVVTNFATGFSDLTIFKGDRTLIITDSNRKQRLLNAYDASGGDFAGISNLLVPTLPDDLGLNNTRYTFGSDPTSRQEAFASRALGFPDKAKFFEFRENLKVQDIRMKDTRIVTQSLIDQYKDLDRPVAGFALKLTRDIPAAIETVRNTAKVFIRQLGLEKEEYEYRDKDGTIINVFDKYSDKIIEAQKAYDINPDSTKAQDDLRAAKIRYLEVQLLYIIARLRESPEGGPARLAAQDIDIQAKAIGVGSGIKSFAQAQEVLDLILEETKVKAEYLNYVSKIKDPNRIVMATTLYDALTERESGLSGKGTAMTMGRLRQLEMREEPDGPQAY